MFRVALYVQTSGWPRSPITYMVSGLRYKHCIGYRPEIERETTSNTNMREIVFTGNCYSLFAWSTARHERRIGATKNSTYSVGYAIRISHKQRHKKRTYNDVGRAETRQLRRLVIGLQWPRFSTRFSSRNPSTMYHTTGVRGTCVPIVNHARYQKPLTGIRGRSLV